MNPFEWTRQWAVDKQISMWWSPETDSTNRVARDDISQISLGIQPSSLYIANQQTAGRGRSANSWLSHQDAALLSSWSFPLHIPPQPILAPLVGLALFEAVSEVWPQLQFSLKAPNDLFLSGKKVAGILIEVVSAGANIQCIVGLGLNVLKVPQALSSIATCIADHLSVPLNDTEWETEWRRFLDSWFHHLGIALRDGQLATLSSEARARLRTALNLHIHLAEPILEIDNLGQLHFATHILRWQDL
jgi:BirA family biotin operon repressor/biotin-[acetyl-CoA-carboxylase] ligase